MVDSLAAFEPFGAGNPKPVFVTGGLTLRDEPFVMKDKHLKLKLWDGERRLFEAVWWDGVERSKGRTPQAGQSIEIAYTPEANVWQGNRSLQLIVEDIRLDTSGWTSVSIRHSSFERSFRATFALQRLAAIAVMVLVIVVGFYRERNKSTFRLKPEDTKLSKDVVAEVNGYERLETDGDIKKYYLKADHAKTFSDNHQELDNVYIEVYGDGGAVDKMAAQRALYVPKEDRDFTAYLAGDVNIDTRDSLNIKTENIVYTKKDETAVADDLVKFERENVKGQSSGANVNIAQKTRPAASRC